MLPELTAVILGASAIAVYIAGVRRRRRYASIVVAVLVTGTVIAAGVVLVYSTPLHSMILRIRSSRRQEAAVLGYLEELGGVLGESLADELRPGARILVVGGPGGLLEGKKAETLRKALERAAGLSVEMHTVVTPQSVEAEFYNELIGRFRESGIDVIVSTIPLRNRRELIYELELLESFQWDTPPVFAAVSGYYYNPEMLRSYIREGLLETAVIYTDEEGTMRAVGAGNMEDMPDVSPGELPRYRTIEQLGEKLGRKLSHRLGEGDMILKIGGPAEGYLDRREASALKAAFEGGAGFAVRIAAIGAPEEDDVESLNELIGRFEDWDISLIISALPVIDHRDRIYGLEELVFYRWEDVPLFAAVAGGYYNPDMLRQYLEEGLLSAASLYRPGEEEMIVVDAGDIAEIPDVSPREALRYTYFERLGELLGRKLAGRMSPGDVVLMVGGPSPKTYLDRRETAAMKEAFEAGAGFSIEAVSVDAPAGRGALAFNEVIEPFRDRDIALIISLIRLGLPAVTDPMDPRIPVRYELEDVSSFDWPGPPLFAAMVGTSYDPGLLEEYIRDGLLHAVALYPPGGGRKIVIDAGNLDEMPEAPPFSGYVPER